LKVTEIPDALFSNSSYPKEEGKLNLPKSFLIPTWCCEGGHFDLIEVLSVDFPAYSPLHLFQWF